MTRQKDFKNRAKHIKEILPEVLFKLACAAAKKNGCDTASPFLFAGDMIEANGASSFAHFQERTCNQ